MPKEKPSTWKKCCYASDESGKGNFFGGVTVAGVYLNKDAIEQLKKEAYYDEIRDSKDCDNKWINKYAPQIMKVLGQNNYICEKVEAKKFNKKWNIYRNMNCLLAELYNFVHLKLQRQVEKKAWKVIDAYVKSKEWTPLEMHNWYLKNKVRVKPILIDEMCSQTEEKYLASALASIIARYYYLEEIEIMTKKYEIRIPLGRRYYGKESIVLPFKKLEKVATKEEFYKNNFVTSLKKIDEIFTKDLVGKNCNKCNNYLIFKTTKKGNRIIICLNPDCNYYQGETDEKKLLKKECPLCTAPLANRINSKDQTHFTGCSGYPKCKYNEPESIRNTKCELCRAQVIKKKTGKKYIFDCINEDCSYKEKLRYIKTKQLRSRR